MASLLALRSIVGAALVLGTLDLLWLNLVLGPRVFSPVVEAPQRVELVAAVAPRPASELTVEDGSAPSQAAEPTAAPSQEPSAAPSPDPSAAASPEPTAASAAARPERIRRQRVYFGTGSTELGDSARAVLDRIARSAGRTRTFFLEGHADHRGSESLNQMLSRQRALAVQSYLESLGIASSQIQVGYAGKTAAEHTGPLWRDRRVEIQIMGGP